jgi:hypothetical protein
VVETGHLQYLYCLYCLWADACQAGAGCGITTKRPHHQCMYCLYCLQRDESQAVLHYYFGAQGGDTLSRMALGYRHLYGLGVPKSCWAAAGYLQLVAEEVLEAATKPSTLPHLERIRLNVQATQVGAPPNSVVRAVCAVHPSALPRGLSVSSREGSGDVKDNAPRAVVAAGAPLSNWIFWSLVICARY